MPEYDCKNNLKCKLSCYKLKKEEKSIFGMLFMLQLLHLLTGKGNKEEDFEIHKKEDSVQKKRHYRNNNKDNDSSGSDSDVEHTRRVS